MKKSFDAATQTVTFKFDDDLADIVLAVADVHADNQVHAVGHGLMQRLGDAAAIPRTQKDGSVITVTEAMRHAEVLALRNHYASGSPDWNMKGGTRAAPENTTIRAIATKLGVTYAEAEAEVQKRMLAEMTA